MSKQTEALKLALEALIAASGHVNNEIFVKVMMARDAVNDAIREALAEQQEPVVWMYVNKSTHETKFQKHMRDFVDHGLWAEVPLYGEPLANHELQSASVSVERGEPVAWMHTNAIGHVYFRKNPQDKTLNPVPLYTSPPASKPWVGLTQQDIDIAFDDTQEGGGFNEFARAIEGKLKEKNNG